MFYLIINKFYYYFSVWDGPVAALWQGGRGQEADEHNLVQR